MDEVNIELFPASYGESILIGCKGHYNTNILIDMGFLSTYNNSLKKRLKALSENNESLNLLVFTHIDSDHLSGGLGFLKENGNLLSSNVINVKEIWFNSIKHLKISENKFILDEKEKLILKHICSKRYPKEFYLNYINNISCEQGLTLAKLIQDNGYKWNESPIIRSDAKKLKKISINNEVSITILSPTQSKLNELIDVWKEQLLLMGIKDTFKTNSEYDKAFELLLVNILSNNNRQSTLHNCSFSIMDIETLASEENFKEDESKINGSSISFVLEFNDKKFLFLADSHPSVIEEGLKYYNENKDEKISFDAVKISHHGSANNTSNGLLKMIKTDKYIICTNGARFGHPSNETIARIISCNPDVHKKIISNYRSNSIVNFINKSLQEKYNYEIICTNSINIQNDKCKVTNVCIEGEGNKCKVTTY